MAGGGVDRTALRRFFEPRLGSLMSQADEFLSAMLAAARRRLPGARPQAHAGADPMDADLPGPYALAEEPKRLLLFTAV